MRVMAFRSALLAWACALAGFVLEALQLVWLAAAIALVAFVAYAAAWGRP
ncbi:hypothetical protein AVMA1855_03825 [Acidovorax sp. SUPP1855]|nr:hypothetical protein [Acidovorax sp. SUPP1855]GKS83239.1 hypothetical protein AVMA1855_03825 [Acidovorax sp. SUPP1855]